MVCVAQRFVGKHVVRRSSIPTTPSRTLEIPFRSSAARPGRCEEWECCLIYLTCRMPRCTTAYSTFLLHVDAAPIVGHSFRPSLPRSPPPRSPPFLSPPVLCRAAVARSLQVPNMRHLRAMRPTQQTPAADGNNDSLGAAAGTAGTAHGPHGRGRLASPRASVSTDAGDTPTSTTTTTTSSLGDGSGSVPPLGKLTPPPQEEGREVGQAGTASSGRVWFGYLFFVALIFLAVCLVRKGYG